MHNIEWTHFPFFIILDLYTQLYLYMDIAILPVISTRKNLMSLSITRVAYCNEATSNSRQVFLAYDALWPSFPANRIV
jgi:hypothetical protein